MADTTGPVMQGYGDLEEIGRGGFGVVYRARQGEFNRTVAIKVLTARYDEQGRQRFERERMTMGSLSDHPNIVTVFGSGFTNSKQPYIVMEYMSGGTLGELIEREGSLPWQRATDIGVKLADALSAAHRAGVLHRDVKPENVFLSGYGQAKLGDFGIARMFGGPETRSGVITASIAHAAPEVLDGKRPTEASDVYSLASTIYELLAGAPAFASTTDESVVPLIARIATEPLPLDALRQHGVPEPVCTVLADAMTKDADQRLGTATEFGRRLEEAAVVAGAPRTVTIPAPPPPGTTPSPGGGQPPGGGDAPPPGAPSPDAGAGRSRRRGAVVVGAIAVIIAVGVAVAVATSSGGSEQGTTPTTSSDDNELTPTSRPPNVVATDVAPNALEQGECWTDPGGARDFTATAAENVDVVRCSDPHDLEVYSRFDYASDDPAEPFPGDQVLNDFAASNCINDFGSFVGRDAESSEFAFYYTYPSEASWPEGDRRVTCSLYRDDLGTVRGTAKNRNT